MKKKINILLIKLIVVFLCFVSIADEIKFQVTVDRNKVCIGEPVKLQFTFFDTQNVNKPDLGKIEGFTVNYLGPSTVVNIVNGKISTSITHNFNLLPLKTGKFRLGPFLIKIGNKTYTSEVIEIEVLPAKKDSGNEEERIDDVKERIFLTLEVEKNKVYVNEAVPINVKLYVSNFTLKDIQLPTLTSNVFLVDKFKQKNRYQENIGGLTYEVIEFSSTLTPIKSGQFILGPAKLNCNVLIPQKKNLKIDPFGDDFFRRFFDDDFFDNFFTTYKTFSLELESAYIPITVLALPEEGKPLDFDGAVGNFTLDVKATPLEVKVADPITVNIKIKGKGNFSTVKLPKFSSTTGFKIYESQTTQDEGEKNFELVFIPETSDLKFIPEISFSFFNPETSKYLTLKNPPIPIKVIDTDSSKILAGNYTQSQVFLQEKLGKDIMYIKTSLGKLKKKDAYLYKDSGFWKFHIIISILTMLIIIFRLRYLRLKTDKFYLRKLKATKKAKRAILQLKKLLDRENQIEFFDVLFKTLKEYLAARLNLSSKSITVLTIDEIATEKEIPINISDKLKKIFSSCDNARYGYVKFSKEYMQTILNELKDVIDYFEKNQKML